MTAAADGGAMVSIGAVAAGIAAPLTGGFGVLPSFAPRGPPRRPGRPRPGGGAPRGGRAGGPPRRGGGGRWGGGGPRGGAGGGGPPGRGAAGAGGGGSGPRELRGGEHPPVLASRVGQAELDEDRRDVLLDAAQRDLKPRGDRLVR